MMPTKSDSTALNSTKFMHIKLLAAVCMLVGAVNCYADKIDDLVKSEIQRRNITGLSLVVIDGGEIVKVAGYGLTEKGGSVPVTATTLFQAGSVSKSVSAMAALHLVEQGKLNLDDDVNEKLVSWKVVNNEFTVNKKVTLREILSHSAGVNVHGFPGYAVDAPKPTLIQVLNGEKPANTDPIRVVSEPGSKWDYSGGGYTIMQQLMIDVTGQAFPEIMKSTVLVPLGMNESTFIQPVPDSMAGLTASGYLNDRSKVPGKWHVYPEMAAAGLWTTPSDLARFVIGVQQSLAGKSNPVISQSMTSQMLTVQKDTDGLGVFLGGKDKTLEFSHNGRDEGFDTLMVATAQTGQGLIVMINTNDNSQMMQRIRTAVASIYHWPGADSQTSSIAVAPLKLNGKSLRKYSGYYNLNGQPFTFIAQNGHLINLSDGLPDDEFLAIDSSHFVSTDGQLKLRFMFDGKDESSNAGNVVALELIDHEHIMKMDRIGALAHTIARQTSNAQQHSDKINAAIKVAVGGIGIPDSPYFSAGLKKILGTTSNQELAGISSIKFLAQHSLPGAGFSRADTKINTVQYFHIFRSGVPKNMLVYLTADGLIADYDIVDD